MFDTPNHTLCPHPLCHTHLEACRHVHSAPLLSLQQALHLAHAAGVVCVKQPLALRLKGDPEAAEGPRTNRLNVGSNLVRGGREGVCLLVCGWVRTGGGVLLGACGVGNTNTRCTPTHVPSLQLLPLAPPQPLPHSRSYLPPNTLHATPRHPPPSLAPPPHTHRPLITCSDRSSICLSSYCFRRLCALLRAFSSFTQRPRPTSAAN